MIALACDACLRRAWLVQRLGPRLEVARHEAVRLPEVLALPDADLVAALGGKDAARLGAEYEAFDAAQARIAALEAELAVAEAVGRSLLVRNAELAAREPIEVIVQGREVVEAVERRCDFLLWELEGTS